MLLLFEDSFCLQTGNPFVSKDYFTQRSKNQNTTGWILLAGGSAIVVGGLIGFGNSWDSGSNASTDIYGFIVLGRIVADFVSIPFFICAGPNRRISASLNLTNELNLLPKQNSIGQASIPSLHLKINS